MRIEITADEILRAYKNLNLMELSAAKGFPITPISRQIDWNKVKKVTHHQNPSTNNHIIEWVSK